MRDKYQKEIENRIQEYKPGYAFTAIDFMDIADTDPINKALSRLNEEGYIRRIVQGVYDKPIYSDVLKEYGAPNIDSIAFALARKFNWTIGPAGETALNYLHLSTQISNSWCYISDGPYREYEIGPYILKFKHCTNKEISGRSAITIAVIQSLKYIGKEELEEEDINTLKQILSDEDKETVIKESQTAQAWIKRILKRMK